MIRAAVLILSGNILTFALQFARNLLIARLLSVSDYGVAATFATVSALIEMVSALGAQQQIIQAREGNDPRFQAAFQGFQILRGCISGLAILAIAGPLATFLGIPEVAWAYRLLSVIPILGALTHFDIYRLHREMRFAPDIISSVLPALASLLLIFPLVTWLGDWRVMPAVILVQAVLTTLISHLVAERPWRVAFDRATMAINFRFGLPLLLNGVLLFFVMQGDRLIVGRILGMEALAIFAMGVTLTLTPTLFVVSSVQRFFLPQLSSASSERFALLANVTILLHLLFGGLLVVLTLIFGVSIVWLLLGSKYASLGTLLLWMAIPQALRMLKDAFATIALAKGQSGNALAGNLPRAALIPLAFWALEQTGRLETVIALSALAEFIGVAAAFALVVRRIGLDLRPLGWPTGLMAAAVVAAALGNEMAIPTEALPHAFASLPAVILLFAATATMRPLWKYIRYHLRVQVP